MFDPKNNKLRNCVQLVDSNTKFPKGCLVFDLFVLLGKANGFSNFGGQIFVIDAIQCQF